MTEEAGILSAAVALSLVGALAALAASSLARRVADLVGLLGGVVILLMVAFHLAPELIAAGGLAPGLLVAGVLVGLLLELAFRAWRAPAMAAAAAWLGLLLIAIHSTLDGAVYAAVMWQGDPGGRITAMGLALHEAPEGVAAMALALQTGLGRLSASLVAAAASALTTPLGWVAATLIGRETGDSMQTLLAASAGLLLYVSWHLIAHGWRALRAGERARS